MIFFFQQSAKLPIGKKFHNNATKRAEDEPGIPHQYAVIITGLMGVDGWDYASITMPAGLQCFHSMSEV